MAPSTLSFNTALITGGGGGIGYALAKHLISINKKVIIAGRTESKLKEAVQTLGNSTAYYLLDTGDIASIPEFIAKLTTEHPDVDCLINNAGVQRLLDVNDFDLAKADEEININIRGPMHLAIGLLPHLKSKKSATIVNVSSVLGFVPFSIINPVYNGTKAWLHFWTMNLRTQLAKDGEGRGIQVVEIAPPTVATELQ
jgi:short-subunit dehydrogenase involved in D-alanine esterification of teichoic acids